VAKILVADDNSNVQKTVALALADLGIEVIAVNNGEAAVKKLPDVMPDLVLADIFMPVRNGYEVCEYVKKDARFTHVPVVLLVGAFDPLDEREAQRVGADGILKKPFVPPDPLIAMVKTLLERAGTRTVTAAVSKIAAAKQNRAGGVAVADEHNAAHAVSEETEEEPVTTAPSRMSFEDSEGLVAFSQLLDAPELKASSSRANLAGTDDNELILTSKRDESLGAPIFWQTENPEQQLKSAEADPQEEAQEPSEIPALGWRVANEPSIANAEVEAQASIPEEPLVLVHDEKEEIANQVSTVVEASPLLLQDPATQASLHVESSKAEDLAANPLEWMASVPLPKPVEEVPANVFEWSPTVPEPTDHIEAKEPELREPAPQMAAAELPDVIVPTFALIPDAANSAKPDELFSIPEPRISPIPESAVRIAVHHSEEAAQSVEDTVRSIPKQEWSELAATVEPPEAQTAAVEAATLSSAQVESKIEDHAVTVNAPWSPGSSISNSAAPDSDIAVHTKATADWADLVSDLNTQFGESKSENHRAPAGPVQSEPVPSEHGQNNAAVVLKAPIVAETHAPVTPVSKPSGSVDDTARSLPKLNWTDLASNIQPGAAETHDESAELPTAASLNASTTPQGNGKSASISALAAALEIAGHRLENGAATSVADSQPGLSAGAGIPDPALVEAVVQRVLDKMRPQVVDIITKEFLRPVVQALVHREITKR
jgi:CheY-like chemotaxis protein